MLRKEPNYIVAEEKNYGENLPNLKEQYRIPK